MTGISCAGRPSGPGPTAGQVALVERGILSLPDETAATVSWTPATDTTRCQTRRLFGFPTQIGTSRKVQVVNVQFKAD